jgi:hypothetical protein
MKNTSPAWKLLKLSVVAVLFFGAAANNVMGQVPGKPASPTGISGDSQVVLSWSAPSSVTAITGYDVQWTSDNLFATNIHYSEAAGCPSNSTALSCTVTGLTNGTTYYFRVAGINSSGTGLPSPPSSGVTPVPGNSGGRFYRPPRDLNGDGKSDVVWRNSQTGDVAAWLMNGSTITDGPVIATMSDLNWQIAGTGDFNGDGKADLVWRNNSTGAVALWLMNGATITDGPVVGTVSDLNWQIAGIGDFNGDGKADLVWRNNSTGAVAMWLMNGSTITDGPVVGTVSDLNWQIAEIGDLNGDGKADVVWRNNSTGAVAMWLMNGATITDGPVVGTVSDLNWQIAK